MFVHFAIVQWILPALLASFGVGRVRTRYCRICLAGSYNSASDGYRSGYASPVGCR